MPAKDFSGRRMNSGRKKPALFTAGYPCRYSHFQTVILDLKDYTRIKICRFKR